MPIPRDRRDLIATVVAVTLSAVTVVTCSALGSRPQPRPSSASAPSAEASAGPVGEPTAVGSSAASAEVEAARAPITWAGPADLGASEEGNALPALPRFYSALARLHAGLRHDHVRIVWLGDSHTQADVWTEAVRSAMQSRFGNGGPGFVHVGWSTYGYRHANVELRVSGSWSISPLTLVSVTKVDDGVFGLGGLRVEPRGGDSEATVIASAAGLPGKGTWDLALRFVEEDASVVVVASGGAPMRIEANPKTLGHIRHVELTTPGPGGQLRVEQALGRVQLLGAVAESDAAYGVVLDTLGLNGARVRSALAWDEATWGAELERRRPDLVVLAFGTNESSNLKLKAELHASRVKALVARIRAAAPESDCLIFGPIDRGGDAYGEVIERINKAQAEAAREAGCAFWDGQRAMGGKGSMQRWAASSPPLGGGDRIHLYPRGYQRLGEMLARDILRAYGAGVEDDAADADAGGAEAGAPPARTR